MAYVELSLGVLGTEVLGSLEHVVQSGTGLGPLTGLETTVRVDPELLRLKPPVETKKVNKVRIVEDKDKEHT